MTRAKLEWYEPIDDLSNIDHIVLETFPPFQHHKKSPSNFQDLTGQQFGRLTVLYRGTNVNKWNVTWVCQCFCEKHTIIQVKADNLRSGNTNSCGCYLADKNRDRCKKYNDYDLSGEYGIGYCNNSDMIFYFDLEDYDKIKNFCWYYSKRGYIESRSDGKLIKLHRLVMNVNNPKIEVDHIYHDEYGLPRTYDNRKINLRICNHQKNMCNSKIYANNTSGVTGVSFDKRVDKWRARISYNNQECFLGYFNNKQDAINARQQKERELFNIFQYKEYKEDKQ